MFSMLATQFKSEITTLEDLKEKILQAPIVPKPICRSLLYTFDWKGFITDKLCDPGLKYQSKYNSFIFTMEKKKVHLRAKKLPQHGELVSRAGIQLINKKINFEWALLKKTIGQKNTTNIMDHHCVGKRVAEGRSSD